MAVNCSDQRLKCNQLRGFCKFCASRLMRHSVRDAAASLSSNCQDVMCRNIEIQFPVWQMRYGT